MSCSCPIILKFGVSRVYVMAYPMSMSVYVSLNCRSLKKGKQSSSHALLHYLTGPQKQIETKFYIFQSTEEQLQDHQSVQVTRKYMKQ